jgi:hypothetical protein
MYKVLNKMGPKSLNLFLYKSEENKLQSSENFKWSLVYQIHILTIWKIVSCMTVHTFGILAILKEIR